MISYHLTFAPMHGYFVTAFGILPHYGMKTGVGGVTSLMTTEEWWSLAGATCGAIY